MKYAEIKKEQMVSTLSHPDFVGKADGIARKRISIILGSVSPSRFAAALKAAKTETANMEKIADDLIAWIADPRNGKRDQIADRAGVTLLCSRALEAAINKVIVA